MILISNQEKGYFITATINHGSYIPEALHVERIDDMALYPDNLKSKAVLWLWELRDIAIIGVGALISVFAMAQLGFLPPVVITAAYAFLSIRLEDTSILDFLRYAIRYFLLGQQTYAWGLCNPSTDRSDRK